MGSGSTASLELVVGLKDQASKGLGDIGDKGGFLKNALGFATGGLIEKGIESIGGSLTGFFGDAISESKGWNDAMGQTDAVIKSTGGSAGVTRQQVEDLANSLSANNGLSKFADDAVASGENLLLTFTGIGKDVFPQATQTMLDMSQAMGGDMKGTAIQLGKALNDPAQGLSALTRVGVTFTEQQKEQIKAMVKAGDTAGAQKVMLAELSREFGGSAKAAADAAGPMVQLGAQFDNIKQTVGDALLPVLNTLMQTFSGFLSGAMPAITAAIQGIGAGFSALFQAFQGNGQPLLDFFNNLGGVFGPIGTFLVNIIANFQAFFATLSQGGDILGAFATLIGSNFGAVTNLIGGLLEQLGKALPGILAKLGEWGQAFVSWIGPKIPIMLGKLAEFVGSLLNWIFNTALPAIIQKLGEWGKAFIDWVGPKIPPLLLELGKLLVQLGGWILTTALPAVITKLGEWGKAFIDWVGPKIMPLLGELGKLLLQVGGWILGTALPAIIGKLLEWGGAFVAWIGPKIPPLLVELGKLLAQLGGWLITTALPAIVLKLAEWGGAFLGWIAKDVLPTLPAKLGEIASALWTWITQIAKDAIAKAANVGRSLLDGILNGLAGLAEALFEKLKEEIGAAIENIKKFFGIGSPSLVMAAEIGDPIGQGIIVGVERSLSDLAPTIIRHISAAADAAASEWGRISKSWSAGQDMLGGVTGGGNTDYLGGVTSSDYLSNVLSGGGSGGSGGGGGSHAQTVGVPGGPNKGGDQFHIIIHAGRGTNGKEIEDAVASGISQTLYQRQSGRRRGF